MRFFSILAAGLAAVISLASPVTAQSYAQWKTARSSAAQNINAAGQPGLGVQGTYNKHVQFDEAYVLADRTRQIAVGQANAYTDGQISALDKKTANGFAAVEQKIDRAAFPMWGWLLIALGVIALPLAIWALICCLRRCRNRERIVEREPRSCYDKRPRYNDCHQSGPRPAYAGCHGDMPHDRTHNGVREEFRQMSETVRGHGTRLDDHGRQLGDQRGRIEKLEQGHAAHARHLARHDQEIAQNAAHIGRVEGELSRFADGVAERQRQEEARMRAILARRKQTA